MLDELEAGTDDYVKVAIVDIDGVLRGKYLDKGKFLSATRTGFGFCNVVFGWDSGDQCYDNTTYTSWQQRLPRRRGAHRPVDLSGASRGRTVGRSSSASSSAGPTATPLGVCPRQLLRQVIDRVADAGYEAKVGMEFEWFNFSETPASPCATRTTATSRR